MQTSELNSLDYCTSSPKPRTQSTRAALDTEALRPYCVRGLHDKVLILGCLEIEGNAIVNVQVTKHAITEIVRRPQQFT